MSMMKPCEHSGYHTPHLAIKLLNNKVAGGWLSSVLDQSKGSATTENLVQSFKFRDGKTVTRL